jgi:Uma2 family endonuclease
MALPSRVEGKHYTYKDYLELPHDGKRYEIIDGELYLAPSPTTKHQRSTLRLSMSLDSHVRPRRLGEVFIAPYDVILASDAIVQPDVVYVSRARRSIITEPNVQGAPDLVVEVILPSSTRRDQEIKRDLYAKYKVPHYWLVHPVEEWIRAYELGEDGSYEPVAGAHKDEAFSAPPFPDMTVQISERWDDLSDD